MQLVLETERGSYVCLRPAGAFKKLHTHLAEQADIACEVRTAQRSTAQHSTAFGVTWHSTALQQRRG